MRKAWRQIWSEPRRDLSAWVALLVGGIALALGISLVESDMRALDAAGYMLGALAFISIGTADLLPVERRKLAGWTRVFALACGLSALVIGVSSIGGIASHSWPQA